MLVVNSIKKIFPSFEKPKPQVSYLNLVMGVKEMKYWHPTAILFIAAAFLAVSGCIATEKQSTSTELLGMIPQGNDLPEGFGLIYIANDEVDDNSKNILKKNMTEEIEKFYGEKNIGKVRAVKGWYRQPGYEDDGLITIISSEDSALAQAAASNYISNFQRENHFMLPGNVSLIEEARIRNHDATEFKDPTGENVIRYAYLWSSGNLVVLVEGGPDREKSIAFAESVKA
jgi:hypothetical protein